MARRPVRKKASGGGPAAETGAVAKSEGIELRSSAVSALPLLRALLERMRLRDFLEAYITRSGRHPKVPDADAVLVLVQNILLSREPMYGVAEWAEGYASDLLGLDAEQVMALNDDRVGRSLDQVFKADYPSMILALVGHVVREFRVDLDELHNDSTTVTLHGLYEGAEAGGRHKGKETLAITYGHNKDHRPDLKQLLFILTASRDGGVPLYFTAADGNVSDDQTHRESWDLLCQIAGRHDFLYVADSKLATRENLAHIDQRGGRFVTLLPRTRREDREFRQRLRQGPTRWKMLIRDSKERGAAKGEVAVWDEPVLTSEGYRLLWYHSSQKKRCDSQARQRRIERALQELSELRNRLALPRTRFGERAKVDRAVEKILTETRCVELVRVKVYELDEERFRQESPGRPGPETRYRRQVKKRFDFIFSINEERLAEEARDDGTFPLITNDTDLSSREIHAAYKRQPVIEKRFAQLKNDFVVAPVFLKNVWRIEGLLCVYFLAMLTQVLLEREVRRNMKAAGVSSIPLYHEARACKNPSARRLLDAFEGVLRHEVRQRGNPLVVMVTELTTLQRQIIELLHANPKTYGHP